MKHFAKKAAVPFLFLAACTQEAPMSHDSVHQHGRNQIFLTVREQQLAGIATDTVISRSITDTKTIVGIVSVNGNNKGNLSSRIKGRIDRLYIRNTNEYVREGMPVAEIYSEELRAEEEQYLLSLQNKTPLGLRLAESGRNRLMLWGLTARQILDLENTKRPSATQVLLCNRSGTVTGIFISEGQYVEVGTKLLEITDISSVWLEAQLYPDEVSEVYDGVPVEITFPGIPDLVFTGSPVFQNPKLEDQSKIILIRYLVQNPEQNIRPGMMGNLRLSSKTRVGLAVPRSALIMEKEPAIWVQVGPGLYEKRMITTGISNSMEVEIVSGLKEGEVVVSSGVYLLNSEFVLRNGGNSMGGMVM